MKREPMRRKPRSTSYSRRERDTDYMLWIKQRTCSVGQGAEPVAFDLWRGGTIDECQRGIEAHHAGVHGLGNKAADDTCIPLCDHHHDALTDRSGCFAGWPRGAVKQWELAVVTHYQARYASARANTVVY